MFENKQLLFPDARSSCFRSALLLSNIPFPPCARTQTHRQRHAHTHMHLHRTHTHTQAQKCSLTHTHTDTHTLLPTLPNSPYKWPIQISLSMGRISMVTAPTHKEKRSWQKALFILCLCLFLCVCWRERPSF